MIIDTMTERDWPEVRSIYRDGIASGDATFEVSPPLSWSGFCERKIDRCSIVARSDSGIAGWAALQRVSAREVYAGVVEVSVYVRDACRGHGIGSHLLEELVSRADETGLWTLQAGIFPENEASLKLHERFGFRVVGVREKLGKMLDGPRRGEWRDVMLLERRSLVAGTDERNELREIDEPRHRLLFVCIENSNRSQMAEAFSRCHSDSRVEAFSAGSNPSGVVNPKAVSAMREIGYDLSTHFSKGFDELPSVEFDVVVTMGCGDECPSVRASRRENWEIPDPRLMGDSEFRAVRDEIERNVQALIATLD